MVAFDPQHKYGVSDITYLRKAPKGGCRSGLCYVWMGLAKVERRGLHVIATRFAASFPQVLHSHLLEFSLTDSELLTTA